MSILLNPGSVSLHQLGTRMPQMRQYRVRINCFLWCENVTTKDVINGMLSFDSICAVSRWRSSFQLEYASGSKSFKPCLIGAGEAMIQVIDISFQEYLFENKDRTQGHEHGATEVSDEYFNLVPSSRYKR